jgi:uncharacterized membrane protein YGL010W
MRNANELMVQYAAYHRDKRNIVSHFIGIPMIVFSIGVLLARPAFEVGGIVLTPVWIIWALATAWYLTLGNLALGIAVSVVNGVLIYLAWPLAAGSVASWLAWGIGTFVVGWVIQFIGHYYEGKKPAFVDDLLGLLTGPMFVTAEALFALGWGKPLLAEIEQRVGPTKVRDLTQPAG